MTLFCIIYRDLLVALREVFLNDQFQYSQNKTSHLFVVESVDGSLWNKRIVPFNKEARIDLLNIHDVIIQTICSINNNLYQQFSF